ncbi:hypothetical protein SAMD00023353_0104200 [Rosellinia necatrix]|uniref:Uncharacterized protein n=1 Tax=Rosellinia necatrix TaxID=77044 RepID=A0A1S8A4S3_ROSNE|nr:hypothetical protein SAMD00023353_0104200 [Rosellinia necatrix]
MLVIAGKEAGRRRQAKGVPSILPTGEWLPERGDELPPTIVASGGFGHLAFPSEPWSGVE